MEQIRVVMFRNIADGCEKYFDDDIEIDFSVSDARGLNANIDSGAWFFIDWDLPALSGIEVCRRLRCNPATSRVRITLGIAELNARNIRIAAQVGADSYVHAPLTRDTIVDKIKSQIIVPSATVQSELRYGDLIVNHSLKMAYWKNKPIYLMPNQLRLLCFMIDHAGQVFTRTQIMEALCDLSAPEHERTVDVWVGRLRRALRAAGASNMLRTVRSRGYVLDRPRMGASGAKS
jgi:two-component system, OmpR family, phosphate regulon response regulator PhoB